jgi:eukaryotic-like serine/threonine-protein kinase
VEALSEWTAPGYTELRPLGSGGFGSVMLARHDATGTPVAIKYLLPKLRQDPEFAAMFRAEAEALGALDDPHVVRLYEYVESAAGAAIVMELVDGVTLSDILSQHGRTTPEAALVVLYGSLLGLAAAHARGVIHRDFKPRNVLVNAYGASKLTDFGIAARAGTPTIPSGSVAYAPPEQFDGGPASPASDVYAATATFYECLAGRPPFTGPTNDAVIWQHHSADVPMDPVPEPLQPIVARGMAKDPRYRPSDAAALAASLRAAAAGAYGPDWEQRGRSHLGTAAVLLTALWPSAGVPALHVASMEQVQLSQGAQHAHGAQAAHHQVTRAALHRWHLRHILHLDHLARTAGVTVTTAAVVAAAVTVAYTSRAPSGPGTPAHPAVAAYAAPLASLPVTLTPAAGSPIDGNVVVDYDTSVVSVSAAYANAKFSGEIKDATTGEIVRLYAQQFPYTSAPAPIESVTLNPVGGTATYSFTVTPTLATRYQIRLLRSATATTPLATSVIRTVYVAGFELYGTYAPCPSQQAVCHLTIKTIYYRPPAVLLAEMSAQKYLYLGFSPASDDNPPTSMQVETNGVVFSKPQRIADNAYDITVSFSYNTSDGALRSMGICPRAAEAQDGFGLPGPPLCGADRISDSEEYVFLSGDPEKHVAPAPGAMVGRRGGGTLSFGILLILIFSGTQPASG